MSDLKKSISDLNQYEPISFYECPEFYKAVPTNENWLNCPRCNLQPRIWVFDNGRYTRCGCNKNTYEGFQIEASSIMEHYNLNSGDLSNYDSDQLRKNWNAYCLSYGGGDA